MKEILAAAIGIWLVFVLVFASLVGAETGQAPTTGRSPGPKSSGRSKAKIRQAEQFFSRTGPGGDPGSVGANPAALKTGAMVKARVEEKAVRR